LLGRACGQQLAEAGEISAVDVRVLEHGAQHRRCRVVHEPRTQAGARFGGFPRLLCELGQTEAERGGSLAARAIEQHVQARACARVIACQLAHVRVLELQEHVVALAGSCAFEHALRVALVSRGREVEVSRATIQPGCERRGAARVGEVRGDVGGVRAELTARVHREQRGRVLERARGGRLSLGLARSVDSYAGRTRELSERKQGGEAPAAHGDRCE
jgi:hypothetical protein